jgi:glycosyltransferase involved in cell wall biosynthesis
MYFCGATNCAAMVRTKIAFLYSEVAGYFLSAAGELSKQADVLIIRWPVNVEAPFDFSKYEELEIEVKTDFDRQSLTRRIEEFQPDMVVCSGWMDKDYLHVVKRMAPSVKRILTLDNHWLGTWRQRFAALASPFFLKKHFTHAWVPGKPQELFAKKLGFEKVITGFYCADTALFKKKFEQTFPEKKRHFPKRFLFVARYVEHKGIFNLWDAFIELIEEQKDSAWELWCLGTGEEWENRQLHERIRHVGFVQPNEMDSYIADTGVYILPSKFEPWGVSVHEFALAGFPLILSDKVGARELFLENNGWEFDGDSKEALKEVMRKMMNLEEATLLTMAQKSHDLGMRYTTEDWVNKLLALRDE